MIKILAMIEVDEEVLLSKLEPSERLNRKTSIEEAFIQEMGWVQESGIGINKLESFRIVDQSHPGLDYPKLNLAHLLTLKSEERNAYVQMTYNYEAADAYNCTEDDLSICGTEKDGFIEEETLMDYVLGYSGIESGEVIENAFDDENGLELIQDGVTYIVAYVMNSAACSQECEHLDFDYLKLK